MNRKLKIAAIAAALLVAVTFSAMALVSTPSNPAYLGMARSAVPAAEWAKIQAVLGVADDPDDD